MPLFDPLRAILLPALLDRTTVIEIEFAVDDAPSFRVSVGSVVVPYGPSTVAAKLRRVFLR